MTTIQKTKVVRILLIVIFQFVFYAYGQEFDLNTRYGPLERTYTGKGCLDCLEAGRNHCLLSSFEGVCCDKGDPRCNQTALNYDAGKYCAEAVKYDRLTSYFTCPTTSRCPQGNVELDVQEYDRVQGFSDSWAWYQYLFGSICKFRVFSTQPASNIILKVSSIVGTASVRVFIMDKDVFSYPRQAFDVVLGSSQTSFNISSNYFEYLIYVLPDTFSSGSYRIEVLLEQAYQPTAFNTSTNETGNSTSPGTDEQSINEPAGNQNETTITDPNQQEVANQTSTESTNETSTAEE